MAQPQSFQNVTLSLTLPISCQICLGKVRQPVICCNNHVFCSACMEVWLKKASQCPTCRVAITPGNPCREIIGATNESESIESHSIKKRLRKTRGELLLREYEDEIETLLKDNEDLRNKNLSIETQLKTVLDPCTLSISHNEDKVVDLGVLEEWAKKLQAANDLYKKVKLDMEKLKEANRTLRSQNMDLIQENMRLKAEVESRSPQKFGRCTVAALEAKLHQSERDVAQLKRALERSDKYIEDLEAQAGEGEQGKGEARSESSISGEQEDPDAGRDRIAAMRRSLSEMGEASVRTDLSADSAGFPGDHAFLLATSACDAACPERGRFGEAMTPQEGGGDGGVGGSPLGSFSPSTPSSALSFLSLKSPAGCRERKVGFKPLTFLRRLSFDEGGVVSASGQQSLKVAPFSNGASRDQTPDPAPAAEALWGGWQDPSSSAPSCLTKNTERIKQRAGEGTSSEACMNAAYLDKISELDSMMSEGECSSSRGSHLSTMSSQSPTSDPTPELEARVDLPPRPGTGVEASTVEGRVDLPPRTGVEASAVEGCVDLPPRTGVEASAVEGRVDLPPRTGVEASTVEGRVDLPPRTGVEASAVEGRGSGASLARHGGSRTDGDGEAEGTAFSGSAKDTETTDNPTHPAKRKHQRDCSSASPSKLSKLM